MCVVDNHYKDPELAALYNLDSGWSEERDFYVKFASPEKNSVLDLGCGTGLIPCRLGLAGHFVVAVDPAEAMLDVGRRSPGGEGVTWVKSKAQSFHYGLSFDRVLMTGNAFQVLLSPSDLRQCFRVMREHLSRSGRIAIETRNPQISWQDRWDYEIELKTELGLVRERRRWLSLDRTNIHFELEYEFPHKILRSESKIRLWTLAEIESELKSAGLKIVELFGDWQGGRFEKERSDEMIFTLGHG